MDDLAALAAVNRMNAAFRVLAAEETKAIMAVMGLDMVSHFFSCVDSGRCTLGPACPPRAAGGCNATRPAAGKGAV